MKNGTGPAWNIQADPFCFIAHNINFGILRMMQMAISAGDTAVCTDPN